MSGPHGMALKKGQEHLHLDLTDITLPLWLPQYYLHNSLVVIMSKVSDKWTT
jgi:hypothetical protein